MRVGGRLCIAGSRTRSRDASACWKWMNREGPAASSAVPSRRRAKAESWEVLAKITIKNRKYSYDLIATHLGCQKADERLLGHGVLQQLPQHAGENRLGALRRGRKCLEQQQRPATQLARFGRCGGRQQHSLQELSKLDLQFQ